MEENIFESIKHIDENGNEYWYAREMQRTLNYKEWRKFKGVIEKAIFSCTNSNQNVDYHFVQLDKMINIAKGAKRKNENIKGESNANKTHYKMGKDIRDFIKKLGGTMPEDLPTPKKSLKELEKLSNNK